MFDKLFINSFKAMQGVIKGGLKLKGTMGAAKRAGPALKKEEPAQEESPVKEEKTSN